MGVAAQVEPEMAVVLGRVLGLGLGAQHDLVDEGWCSVPATLARMRLNRARLERARLRQLDPDRGQDLAERAHLLERGLVMGAVDQRRARLLERLGGRDVGEDHELLDQPVRVEPLGHDHAIDGAVGLQDDLAFRQVEVERLAQVAGLLHALIGRPERPQHGLEQRTGRGVRTPVDRRLRLLVGRASPPSAS